MEIDEFLNSQLRLSPKTKEDYGKDLSRFEKFLKGRKLTPKIIVDYVNLLREKKRSESYITRILYALKKYCEYKGLDFFHKSGGIEIPGFEFKEPIEVLSLESITKLINLSPSPLEKCLIAVVFDSGARISEILRLSMEDVDWETGVLTIIRKGRRQRKERVAIYPETLKYLKEYVVWRGVKKGLLFNYSYQELREWMLDLAAVAGVKFPRYSLFHNLRHARAVVDRLAGHPMADISDTLGHASITTTAKLYSKLSPQEMLSRKEPPPWARKEK